MSRYVVAALLRACRTPSLTILSDCSTTFQNQDYKSHTSCISEAEKYQGALYRGPRKGQQNNNSNSNDDSGAATPVDSPAPSDGAGTNGIHPSRLNQMQAPEHSYGAPRGRGGFAQRGGRGGFGNNRGGYGGGFNSNPNGGGVPSRKSVTGENRTAPEGGMRTWGSAPASDNDEAKPDAAEDDASSKKKKRKGDKGGTGSKANSRVKEEDVTATEEPAAKKRKRDEDDKSDATPAAPTSDKTLKRLRKHMSKLEDKFSTEISLSDWLSKVGQSKDKTIDQTDILQGVQVSFKDGRWQLSL
jgi:cell growth-regulating nucleolar protein